MVWPPDYTKEFITRQKRLQAILSSDDTRLGAYTYYEKHPREFIEHWGVTYDPRNVGTKLPTLMPFIMFPRQHDLVALLWACVQDKEAGLIEKCRDMGATWVCVAFTVWLWRFLPGTAVGWGSRKESLVDKIGDPGSIFEKIRIFIQNMPKVFWPRGFVWRDHVSYMKIMNPETLSTISGETGDNIGRGGRSTIYFKDEAAHYEHPETIEAALGDNTDVQIDISSVKGTGTVFARRREAGYEWSPGAPVIENTTRVLIMDWREHPLKTQEWYEKRKEKAKREGLLHIFAQEVDRDYSAAVVGIAIPPEHVKAAIDAHVHLKFEDDGNIFAALDVADEGTDNHALTIRKGVVLKYLDEWPQGDGGEATRQTIGICQKYGTYVLLYDSIGAGAAVKSEINRLVNVENVKLGFHVLKWGASEKVLKPKKHIIEDDPQTPLHKDYYENLKAQAWGEVARRFEKTYRARYEGVKYAPGELISLPSSLHKLHKLVKELSQPIANYSKNGRLLIDKAPNSQKSPNLADSLVMNYWPKLPKTTSFGSISVQNKSVWALN